MPLALTRLRQGYGAQAQTPLLPIPLRSISLSAFAKAMADKSAGLGSITNQMGEGLRSRPARSAFRHGGAVAAHAKRPAFPRICCKIHQVLKSMTMRKMVAISVVGLGMCLMAGAQQDAYPLLPVGQKAPDFTAFTPNEEKTTLADYKGKVVILDFWASWCGPCQRSMPGLEKIYQQIKDKNVVVLSMNTWDQKPDYKAWMEKNSGTKYHFNFVRDPAEGDHDAIRKNSIAKTLYKVKGIPTMYVIDKDGNIAGGLVGSGNEKGLIAILGKLGIMATLPPQ